MERLLVHFASLILNFSHRTTVRLELRLHYPPREPPRKPFLAKMRESILNAMSPFGRKSHSRKASGAAVVGGGVRFFSHAQQQQPALFFLFFQSRPRTVNDFSLCEVFFVSRSANRKFSAGAGGFQCCRQVWGVYKLLDRAAVAPLHPPFVEHIFTKKEILPCSFFRFPLLYSGSHRCMPSRTIQIQWLGRRKGWSDWGTRATKVPASTHVCVRTTETKRLECDTI